MTGAPSHIMILYMTPDTTITAGIVRTQAQTIFLAVSHFTRFTPLVSPVPIIEPVTVCVVLTGMPRNAVIMRVKAPDISELNP